jgi:predicted phosphodiesterase
MRHKWPMLLERDVSAIAGRFCPADYRIDHALFKREANTPQFELMYVVGGLYGNSEALNLICDAFDSEPSRTKCMVFNGDFHWFDVSAEEFLNIESSTSRYRRLRGNVETELARNFAQGEADIGCGCAYPNDVSNNDVEYSNRIIRQLRENYQRLRTEFILKTSLAELPIAARFQIGDASVAVTHGDIDSLAGWGLAHNRIAATLENGLAKTLDDLSLDIVASSHTCLPALNRSHGKVIVNNGAAGLANFNADTAGLITRISVEKKIEPPLPIAYECDLQCRAGKVNVQALRVPFDDHAWQQKFLSQWPSGSAAYESYWKRIQLGTSYTVKQAMQYEL